MRRRLLLPATLVAATFAATALALPATSAYADGSQPTPTATATTSPTDAPTDTATATAPPTDAPTDTPTDNPTDTPTATATATATSTPTDTPSPTDSGAPIGTPTPAPTATPSAPVVISSPKPGLPWAAAPQVSYNTKDQGFLSLFAYDYAATASQSITSATATLTPVNVLPGGDPAPVTVQLSAVPGYPYNMYDSPITLPSLGSYSVSVELTDSSGNDVVVNVGQVGYHDILAFSSITAVGPASGELTYDDHTVSASGVLTATDPRTGQQSPVAGVPVTVYYGYGTGSPNPVMGTVTTAADGSFAVPPYVASGAGYVTASYMPPATESLLYGSGGVTQLAQQYFQTQAEQLRVQLTSPTNIDEPAGGSATVTGTVQVLDGGVWKPAPDDQVELENYASSVAPVQGVTDSQGRISLRESVPGTYNLNAESSAFYLWSQAPTTVTVHIPQPTTFRSIGISEDAYGEAVIQAVLKSGDGSQYMASGSWIEAQYSANGKSWYNVGRCSVTSNQVGCYGTYAGKANGYWRVAYPGSVDWQPVTSKAFYLSRDYTWISGGRPSSSHPGRNQREYFSGTLHQYYSGKWHNFPKAKVQLLFRPTGSSTWYLMATATTNGSGNYNISAQDPEGGTWLVTYLYADNAHLDTQGPSTWVGVH